VGTYSWPSGASYHGEWQAGYMHGIGSFESPDGSRYSGGWRKDVKHGLGKKVRRWGAGRSVVGDMCQRFSEAALGQQTLFTTHHTIPHNN